jgi:hypothetical protein
MKKLFFVCVIPSLFISYSAFAEDLAHLLQTKTLVRQQTITYTIKNGDGSEKEITSAFFKRMTSNEECKIVENSEKYTDFELFTITEAVSGDDPTISNWIEGVKIEGTVIKKETQLCFAKAL